MKFAVIAILVLMKSVCSTDTNEDEEKYLYDEETFENLVPAKPHFIMFFAPWCGHCKAMKADWNKLAEYFNEEEPGWVYIGKVDCTEQKDLCKDVKGYPTMKLFLPGKDPIDYQENRDFENLKEFVTTTLEENGIEKKKRPGPWDLRSVEEIVTDGLYNLSGNEYYREMADSNVFVVFHMPFDDVSKDMMETWKEVAKFYKNNENVKIAEVDCVIAKRSCDANGIMGYPTLRFFRDGIPIEGRSVGRDAENLKAYVESKLTEPPVSEKSESKVVEMTNETFDSTVATGITFVKLYAPGCGFCVKMAPAWKELADMDFSDAGGPIVIAQLDCMQYQTTCRENGGRGFPTLVLFMDGEIVASYVTPRLPGHMRLFLLEMANGYQAKDNRRDEL